MRYGFGVGAREAAVGGGIASAVGGSQYGGQEIAGGVTVGDLANVAGGLLARPGAPVAPVYVPERKIPWVPIGLGLGALVIGAVVYKKMRKNPRRRFRRRRR